MRFDWDDGNWPKCARHGVSREEIERALLSAVVVVPDPHPDEERFRFVAIVDDRHVFVVATVRPLDGETLVRPVSARYMHAKEVRSYDLAT